MRAALALCLALTVVPAHARSRPPPRPGPPPVPTENASSTTSDLVALRTPGPEELLLRASSFRMGSDAAEIARTVTLCSLEPAGEECIEELFSNEYAPHDVSLPDFWIDRTEVTLAAFRRCVAAGRCAAPPYGSGGRRFERPELPVVLVGWEDASMYCAWAGKRLPTEAEWERAARGTSGRRYPWGNVYNPLLANHGRLGLDELDGIDGFLELAPVGSYPDGRTVDGLDDMAGNVEEWVADYYAPEYPEASAFDPKGPASGEARVVRGGSFVHGRPWLRAASRGYAQPQARRAHRGFRCARSG